MCQETASLTGQTASLTGQTASLTGQTASVRPIDRLDRSIGDPLGGIP